MSLYRLTDDEAAHLDGRCRPEIQAMVDAAKARLEMAALYGDLTPKEAGLVSDIVREAETNGLVILMGTSIRYCPVCEKSGGYAKYKSGRNRGRENWSKPLHMSGYEFAKRFVVIQGSVSVGCCHECWLKLAPRIREALAPVRAQVSERITGHPPRFMRWDRAKCTKCGWAGHEGEMRKLRTLMGDGWYPGGCPKCPAENTFGVRPIEHVDGFDVVECPTSAQPGKGKR